MKYSIGALEFILENYLELKTGKIPVDKAMPANLRKRMNRSPFETALTWCADVDRAMDQLNPPEHPHIWLKVAQDCNEKRLRQVLRHLDYRQRRLVSYYILNIRFSGYNKWSHRYVSEGELENRALKSLYHLQRLINRRVRT